MSVAFLDGAAIGFAVAVPIGPISLLCAQRACERASGCRRERCGSGNRVRDLFSGRAGLTRRNRPSAGRAPWDNPARQCCCHHCIRPGRYREAEVVLPISPLPARLYTSMLLLALTNPMTILPYLAASTVADDIPLFSGASLLGATGAMWERFRATAHSAAPLSHVAKPWRALLPPMSTSRRGCC